MTRAPFAQLVRSGWFKSVHVKSVDSPGASVPCSAAASFLVNKLRDQGNEIRGLLRPFGLKVGQVTASGFAARILELVADRPRSGSAWRRCFRREKPSCGSWRGSMVSCYELPRTTNCAFASWVSPGVGPVTALAFKTAVDRPDRFRRSSDVGAHLGLTPRQHQSGEIDRRGRIAKNGDGLTRTALFAAANVMLTRSTQWTSLKHWGVSIAKRSSLKKAKVAVARKLCRHHAPDVEGRDILPLDCQGGMSPLSHNRGLARASLTEVPAGTGMRRRPHELMGNNASYEARRLAWSVSPSEPIMRRLATADRSVTPCRRTDVCA